MNQNRLKVEIMDTTLRDGEQMRGVSYSPEEKLIMAKMLLTEVHVDRIEMASARVSKGEEEAAEKVLEWAHASGQSAKIEILGFTDIRQSVDWIKARGGEVINLLTKGSLLHLTKQLKKTKEQHLDDIRKTIACAREQGLSVNVYLEDWSNGMLHSPDYVRFLLSRLSGEPVARFMLPDTLGVLFPEQISAFIGELIKEYPEAFFDFHGHNDYGLAVANSLAAIRAGARAVHVTVNGMGERAGNAALDETVIGVHDFLNGETGVDEKQLYRISQAVEIYSGIRIAFNKPMAGPNVFTQTAGIHADGDRKGNLYFSRLSPERFNRERKYALGKLSGKSNLEYNLKNIGIELTEEQKRHVLERIIQLGDRKEAITEEDLPYIIADVLETPEEQTFQILSFVVVSSMGMKPMATVKLNYVKDSKQKPEELEESAQGDGGYDSFMNAIKTMCKRIQFPLPKLMDYKVTIPPGGKTDALVQCSITWLDEDKRFMTKGVNSDQVLAAIEATQKMLNLVALQRKQARRLNQ